MKISLKTFVVILLFSGLMAACGSEDEAFSSVGGTESSSAINGSYSRILAVGDFLYAVDQTSLITYDISNRDNPAEIDRTDVGFDIETIYHHDGHLFIGSRIAMFTYTISTDGIPIVRGQFDYSSLPGLVVPCDPVVANNTTAYATLYTDLASSSPCGDRQSVESLVIMDISNLDQPTLIRQLDMQTPRGLSLDRDLLFICNNDNGLTVMDVSSPENAFVISRVAGFSAWDVIANDGILVVVGPTEVIQFDYSDPENLVELSRIPMPRV